MALPMYGTDTEEEAEHMKLLFGTLVSHGKLAGRHIIASVLRAESSEEALAEMDRIKTLMDQRYNRMKARKR